MRSAERRKVNVLEIKCLRSSVGVSRMDRVRNEEVHRRAGIERELASRVDERVHIEMVWACGKMDVYCTASEVLVKVSGGQVQGRPRSGWMDGVKVALCNRGMMVEV